MAGADEVHRALQAAGLWLDLGLCVLRVRSNNRFLAEQLCSVYRHFEFVPQAEWADIHAELLPGVGWRRWWRPQVRFRCDGLMPFDPFPADTALPLLEWCANVVIGERMAHVLLLHAGALARDGRALLLPAEPGSGKSTLSAALSLSGWRLLSDEFGAFHHEDGCMRAVLKPVALKNRSIDVIRSFEPSAPLGPVFPKTRRGRVAHLAASAESVALRQAPARPGLVLLPRWEAGSPTLVAEVDPVEKFHLLGLNAFNFHANAEAGYEAALQMARECAGFRLVYSDLDDAMATIDGLWRERGRPLAAGALSPTPAAP
jgi:HprK-related kinase A